ncbi:MAG: NYN domain-containing protein [bacterium]|nr:NYN domain-containing protein [bacterium]
MEISNERTCVYVSKLLTHNEIIKIKFFTAKISGKYGSAKPARQELYLRALRTLNNVEIIEGSFLFSPKKIRITEDVSLTAKIAEEKGTDVNIAVHLVNDAHMRKFDTAVIVSNDSDLAESIRIVTQELGLKVGLINPYPVFNKQIGKYATFKILARDSALLSSQFPQALTDASGGITKPQLW